MVFDPLSVIGFVGTAAGLISFIVTTVGRLEKALRDFRGSGKSLQWYNTKFATFIAILIGWRMKWCNGTGARSDADYESIWGANGFQEMKEKFDLIKAEIDNIGLLLSSAFDASLVPGDRPTTEDWERWKDRVNSLAISRRESKPKLSWISQACFALFRGTALEERTKRLEEMIDDLNEFSTEAFCIAQGRTDVAQVTEAELLHLLDRKRWVDQLSQSLTQLYNECDREVTLWSLVLSPPDEEGGPLCMDDQTDILLEFDVSPIGIIPLRCSQLKHMEISTFLQQATDSTEVAVPTRRSGPLKEVLRGTGLSYNPFNDKMDFEIARTTTALGLVNWTILLWHTPWTSDLCTCRIRYIFIEQQGENHIATLAAMHNNLVPPPCHNRALESHKALLLGVSLAELAINKTITVSLNSAGRPSFSIDRLTISEIDLLERVKNESCNNFRQAVRYCLLYDSKIASAQVQFRPVDIISFKKM